MIQGVDVIYLHAKNGEQTGKWYEEVLGLNVKFKTPDSSWQEYDFDASPPTRFAVEATPLPDTSQGEKQSIMISFRVADVEAAVDNLERKGVEFYGTPKIKEEGVSRFVTLKDPEGNLLQLSQRIK
jgi:predicted enzyme related to lactoylglutathione lyase